MTALIVKCLVCILALLLIARIVWKLWGARIYAAFNDYFPDDDS